MNHFDSIDPPSWGEWSNWNECSETCEGGDQIRTRECIDADCRDPDGECDGEYEQSQRCNEDVCCPGEFTGYISCFL